MILSGAITKKHCAPDQENNLQGEVTFNRSFRSSHIYDAFHNWPLKGNAPLLIQKKLQIGNHNDQDEKEADRIAEEVMRMTVSQTQQMNKTGVNKELPRPVPALSTIAPLVQKQIESDEINVSLPFVHTKISSMFSGGKLLSDATRTFFEPRFGYDFSSVRIYTDSQIPHSTRAFAIGQHIVFNKGQYSPETISGKRLLAHELVHVVQQRSGSAYTIQQKSKVTRKKVAGATKLDVKSFLALTSGKSVSIAALSLDPNTAGVRFKSADLNSDGKISSEDEWRAVYNHINRYLGRHKNSTLILRHKNIPTAAGLFVASLGRLSQAKKLIKIVGDIPLKHGVTLVGMSDTAIAEARALRKKNRIPVQLITDSLGRRDEVRLESGQILSLGKDIDRQNFVKSLPISRDARQQVLHVLTATPSGARREIGELARVWSHAYIGKTIPRRVILSGHGDGTWITGDDHDFFNKNSVLKLGRALPKAARYIYSFNISSCQHGYDRRLRAFRKVFPNIQMIWGYAGSSPSGYSAHRHMIVWEKMSRNFPAGGSSLDKRSIARTRRADVTAVWTRSGGWKGPEVRPFSELLDKANSALPKYQQYFFGKLTSKSSGRGFLYDYYNLLQQLVVHPEMDSFNPYQKRVWKHRKNQTLRLRLYKNVARNFHKKNKTKISRGYRALSLIQPNYGQLDRRSALYQIEMFRKKMNNANFSPDINKSWIVLEGLRVLDEKRIPMAWVE